MAKMQRILSHLYELQEETQGQDRAVNEMVELFEKLVVEYRCVSWGI
jgi:hypothetical protein